jgi:hypothetical protein
VRNSDAAVHMAAASCGARASGSTSSRVTWWAATRSSMSWPCPTAARPSS